MTHYNCVIIGGGAVGSTLAIALAKLNYSVLLVDKKALPPVLPQQMIFRLGDEPPSNRSVYKIHEDCEVGEVNNAENSAAKGIQHDSKTIALSYASYAILSALNVWHAIDSPIPIEDVLVTVKGGFGSSRLNRNKQPLGFVLGLSALEHGLAKAMQDIPLLTVLRPAALLKYERDEKWQLEIEGIGHVSCDLLVSAEGIQASLRDAHFIQVRKKEYDHAAVVCHVNLAKSHHNLAYERFLPQGAIALLPWHDNQFTMVWSVPKEEANKIMSATDEQFIAQAQQALGNRLGKISHVSKRNVFPLQMQIAINQSSSRFLLIGNSAHSLHPIAAQGLNLSLRDIWQIRSQILKSDESQLDLGNPAFLAEYIQARVTDQNKMIALTDFLAEWVSGKMPTFLKGVGLTLFDSINPLKRQFTYFGMGLM